MKLDLGCGRLPAEGFVGLDLAICEPDVVWNAETDRIPFEDNEVEAIRAHHFIEHVHNIFNVFNEAYRVLVPGGDFDIYVPHSSTNEAWQDPTHVRAFNEGSWYYYSKEATERWPHMGLVCGFAVRHRERIGFQEHVVLRAVKP